MSNKWISLIIKICCITIAICILLICVFWYPFSISLTAIGLVNDEISSSQQISFWSQLIFYWIACIPFLVALIQIWLFANEVKNNNTAGSKSLNIMKRQAIIVSGGSCFFLIGNIVFSLLKLNDFGPIYYLASAVLFAVSGLLWAVYLIIKKANSCHI